MAEKPDLHVFDDPAKAYAAAAAVVGAVSSEAIAARGFFTVALTGGSAAKGLHPVLAKVPQAVEWVRTRVFWGDERAVPPDHPDSNYRLGMETLLSKVPVSREHIHRMRAEDPDLDFAAQEYAKSLPEKLDLIILGLGPDGHLCSLFPGFPQLEERMRLVVPVEGSPKPPPRRMTITPPVLESARKLLMIATGEEKAEAVAKALAPDGKLAATPARLARAGTWIVSRDAASKLAR